MGHGQINYEIYIHFLRKSLTYFNFLLLMLYMEVECLIYLLYYVYIYQYDFYITLFFNFIIF